MISVAHFRHPFTRGNTMLTARPEDFRPFTNDFKGFVKAFESLIEFLEGHAQKTGNATFEKAIADMKLLREPWIFGKEEGKEPSDYAIQVALAKAFQCACSSPAQTLEEELDFYLHLHIALLGLRRVIEKTSRMYAIFYELEKESHELVSGLMERTRPTHR